jgi:hypothetical protein
VSQQPESPSTTIKLPMRKSTIIAISIVVIAVVIAASILLFVMNRPNPEIISQNSRQSGYQFYVDVTVRNNGASGWVKVFAQIDTSGQFEKKDTRIYLGNGESKSTTFQFTLTFPQGSSGMDVKNTVWAVAD